MSDGLCITSTSCRYSILKVSEEVIKRNYFRKALGAGLRSIVASFARASSEQYLCTKYARQSMARKKFSRPLHKLSDVRATVTSRPNALRHRKRSNKEDMLLNVKAVVQQLSRNRKSILTSKQHRWLSIYRFLRMFFSMSLNSCSSLLRRFSGT